MAKTSISAPKAADLLDWYRAHGRDLPWRSYEGRAPSPYHTWLSEIMLQQTGVITVIPYYERFTIKWPSVHDLAAAHEDDVLKEWAGLGYYSRARNLLKCARLIATDYSGIFPDDVTELKKLPGIGDYTANAIRAIAFDKPANVVDGNVERVTARVFAFDQPINLPANKVKLKELAATLSPQTENSHYAQAIMDLGATICTPRNPQCPLCPWNKNCLTFATGQTDKIPVVQKRAKIPERQTSVFVMHDKQNRFLLRQRPAKGLLGGLWEFPSTNWDKAVPENEVDLSTIDLTDFIQLPKPVIHVFTHFKLTSTVFVHRDPVKPETIKSLGQWFDPDNLPALSTLTVKILAAARNGLLKTSKTG
jgi:A/G-specific adenine glycosylase